MGSDPRNPDTDGDGLIDGQELIHNALPLNPDSDGDGLLDGAEVHQYGTLPNDADTDGDGLSDGFEIAHGFNPLLGGEEAGDPDNDGLDNLGEQAEGTDPQNPDTDGDGLSDGDEVLLHDSEPLLPDTDGDHLGDFAEVEEGTLLRERDSDGGGRWDGAEVLYDGTEPLLAADDRLLTAVATGESLQDLRVAADNAGNFHLVWTDSGAPFYAMVGAAGEVRIAATLVGNESVFGSDVAPAIVVDALGKVHLAWFGSDIDDQLLFYSRLNPAAAAQDGSPSTDTELSELDDTVVHFGTLMSSEVVLAVDASGAHLVWDSYEEVCGSEVCTVTLRLHHLKLDSSANPVVGPQLLWLGSGDFGLSPPHPSLALEANGDLNVIWTAESQGFSAIAYRRLDGTTGATRIASTVLTPEPASFSDPTLGRGSDGKLTVVYQRCDTSCEVYLRRLDPSLDDHNGDAADPAVITVVGETLLSPDDGVDSRRPFASIRPSGTVALTYVDSVNEGDGLRFRIVGLDGSERAPVQAVTEEWNGSGEPGALAASANATGVTWLEELATGERTLRLSRLSPDSDGDGLPDARERALETDPEATDSDGGGASDGKEVFVDDTDPLDPVDDVVP